MPATRDWEDHKIRRRMWDHGFSQKQLKSYEPKILQLIDTFLDKMEGLNGMQGFPAALGGQD
jgi:cytochrome P450